MGVKKIIIPIAVAAVVACGAGYYCYNTTQGTNLSQSITASKKNVSATTQSSKKADDTNKNVSDSTTKTVATTNNEKSTGTTSKVSNTSEPTSSNNEGANTTTYNSGNTASTGATNTDNIKTTNSNNAASSSTKATSSEGISSTGTTNKVSSTETSPKKTWVYAEGYVPSDCAYISVMSEPNSTSSVVTTLSAGDKFFVVSEYNDWAYVQVGGKDGYIPMWYVTYTAPTSSTGTATNNSSSTGTTTSTNNPNSTGTTKTTSGTSSNTGTSQTNSNSQTLSSLKTTSLNKISELNDTVNEINEKTKNENPTQYEIDEAEGNICEIWQGEVNTIYSQLQEALPSSEFSKLQQEQNSWISTTNEEAKSYAENYAGNGSDYSAVLSMKLGEYYQARCYYLVDNYM